MNNATRRPFPRWRFFVLLLAAGLILFGSTAGIRRPWFNTLGDRYTAWQLTSPLAAALNWHREGYLRLRGLMYPNPASVEFPTLETRGPITSHPPGMLAPLYGISRLAGVQPSLALLMGYNLAHHFLIALILALMAFTILRQVGCDRWDYYLLCGIPLVLYFFLPGPLYQHQMRFTPNHAVLVYFSLYVWLEMLRDFGGGKRLTLFLGFLQGVTAFLGFWTDWFFGFVALCVYLKRLARGELGPGVKGFAVNSVVWAAPLALALAVFAVQLSSVSGVEGAVLALTGWLNSPPKRELVPWLVIMIFFWKGLMEDCFGQAGIALLGVSLVIFMGYALGAALRRLLRKPPNTPRNTVLAAMWMLTAPCLFHQFIYYRFSSSALTPSCMLKFAALLALIPFVLLPLLVACRFKAGGASGLPRGGRGSLVARWPVAALGLACGFAAMEAPGIRPLFARETPEADLRWPWVYAQFIAENTRYEDIVFGSEPFMAIDTKSPFLPLAMKRVYLALSPSEILDRLALVEADYTFCITTPRGVQTKPGTPLEQLLRRSYERQVSNQFALYRIRKQDALEVLERHRTPEPGAPAAAPGPGMPMLNLPGDGAV